MCAVAVIRFHFEAAQAKPFPDELNDISNPDMLENVGWPYSARDTREKFIVCPGIFPFDKRCGNRQR
jgi:hypothetical protein